MIYREMIQWMPSWQKTHRLTSESAFSFIVRLADVCCMNILTIPILIDANSSFTALIISDVIRWQPREGAVMDIVFWYQRGVVICWQLFVADNVVDEDWIDTTEDRAGMRGIASGDSKWMQMMLHNGRWAISPQKLKTNFVSRADSPWNAPHYYGL